MKNLELEQVEIQNATFEEICNEVVAKAEKELGLEFPVNHGGDTGQGWQDDNYATTDWQHTINIEINRNADNTAVIVGVYQSNEDDFIKIAAGIKTVKH